MTTRSTRYRIALTSSRKLPTTHRRRLRQVAREVLSAEQTVGADVSVAVVSDREIHSINRDFLGHDYATDVISFLLDVSRPSGRGATGRPGAKKSSGPQNTGGPRASGKFIDGEIIISHETARRNAGRFGWRTSDELCLYLVHGLLHLCGYDDLSGVERRLMRRREAEMLARFKLSPRYVESRRS